MYPKSLTPLYSCSFISFSENLSFFKKSVLIFWRCLILQIRANKETYLVEWNSSRYRFISLLWSNVDMPGLLELAELFLLWAFRSKVLSAIFFQLSDSWYFELSNLSWLFERIINNIILVISVWSNYGLSLKRIKWCWDTRTKSVINFKNRVWK